MGLDATFFQEVSYYRNFHALERAIERLYNETYWKHGEEVYKAYDGEEFEITPERFTKLCKEMDDYDGDWKKVWKKDKKRIAKALKKGKHIYYTSSF